MVLGQLPPRKIASKPKTNYNPNPTANLGTIFLGYPGYLFQVALFFELRNLTHPWWSLSGKIILTCKNRLTLFSKKLHHSCLTSYQIRNCLAMVLYRKFFGSCPVKY